MANTAHESAPLVAADSAPPVVAESAASTAAAAMSSMVTGPPSSKAADQTPRATPESNSAVAGGGAEEEAREGTSRTLIADSLSEGKLLLSATDLLHVGNAESIQADTDPSQADWQPDEEAQFSSCRHDSRPCQALRYIASSLCKGVCSCNTDDNICFVGTPFNCDVILWAT